MEKYISVAAFVNFKDAMEVKVGTKWHGKVQGFVFS